MQDEFFEKAWTDASDYQIIMCDGMPAGYFSAKENEGFISVNEVVILPEFQGRGIGSKILRNMIEISKKNAKPLRLQVLNKIRLLSFIVS